MGRLCREALPFGGSGLSPWSPVDWIGYAESIPETGYSAGNSLSKAESGPVLMGEHGELGMMYIHILRDSGLMVTALGKWPIIEDSGTFGYCVYPLEQRKCA